MPLVFSFNIWFLKVEIIDVLDVLLVALMIYQIQRLFRGSLAPRIFIGVIAIYIFYLVVDALGMELLSAILGQFIGVGVIAGLIVFKPEIRRFLIRIGDNAALKKLTSVMFKVRSSKNEGRLDVYEITGAAKSLADENMGALIVFQRRDALQEFIESGDKIDAAVSKRLLINIFFKNSPLHDGAVIIAGDRVAAARCILPVTDSQVPARYGLRHRAAIGASEQTDAVVLAVSEETAELSLAVDGRLEYNLSVNEVREKLNHYLFVQKFAKQKDLLDD